MYDLAIFKNEEFGGVRCVEIDDTPWFAGRDVASALGYKNTKDALASHVDDCDKQILQRSDFATFENHMPKTILPIEVVEANIPNRGLTFINESGLYSLVLSSKLPGAKRFKRWITSEVIPSIRKRGGYAMPARAGSITEVLASALIVADRLLTEKDRQIERLTAENQDMRPKVEYFDDTVDRELLTGFLDTARAINVPPRKFVNFLLDRGYLYRDEDGKLMPCEKRNKGLFEVKEYVNARTKRRGTQTMVTPKGRETFRLLCENL